MAAAAPTAALIPELLVADLGRSLAFWSGLCGFAIAYDRPEDRFAFLRLGPAEVMLEEQAGLGRRWLTGPMERPFGRGINFQVTVDALDPILARLHAAPWPLFLDPERRSYRVGPGEVTVRQFLVQDPDGYLLRFSQRLVAPQG